MGIASRIGEALKLAGGRAARPGGLAAALAVTLTGAFSGTALAAGVDNPVDPVTGLALPLKPFEKLHLMADGKCGMLGRVDENWDRTSFNWQGACRFGLAHGWGYRIDPAGGKAVWQQFIYGYREEAINPPAGYTKVYRNNRNMGGDFTAVGFAGMDHFDPALYYNQAVAVQVETQAGANHVFEFVGYRDFLCPFQSAFSAAPNYKPSKQQIKLAKKACSKREKGTAAHFIFVSRKSLVRDGAGNWINSAVVEDVRVCEVGAVKDVPSCSGEAIYAVAPLVDRITEVMAADKTAAMDRQRELITRFAPLEVALNARIEAFAAGGTGR